MCCTRARCAPTACLLTERMYCLLRRCSAAATIVVAAVTPTMTSSSPPSRHRHRRRPNGGPAYDGQPRTTRLVRGPRVLRSHQLRRRPRGSLVTVHRHASYMTGRGRGRRPSSRHGGTPSHGSVLSASCHSEGGASAAEWRGVVWSSAMNACQLGICGMRRRARVDHNGPSKSHDV